MKLKIVKGKWYIERKDYLLNIMTNDQIIASVGTMKVSDITQEEQKANAALLVQAPKLFKTIQNLLNCAELNEETLEPSTRTVITKARKLLQQAAGK